MNKSGEEQDVSSAAVSLAATEIVPSEHDDVGTSEVSPADLKRRTARGGLVSIGAQAARLSLRLGSLMILARLLDKQDFGLVGMVNAFTGFLGLFKDAGLSMASVQSASLSEAQMSTLFWVNLFVGAILAVVTALLAPALTTFYGEPRLFWVAIVLSMGFVFSGAAAQHQAILTRQMRFVALSVIEVISLVASIALGVVMALAGLGYWALVASAVSQSVISAVGQWIVTGWIPSRPRRGAKVRSMLRYGGTLTLNTVVVYMAYNTEKVLLGRFLGAETLGLYGRAYQLINLPTDNLNSTIGSVAFPALCRIQNDPQLLRNYFLKGYGLFLSLVMPITVACALFAEDIIRIAMGPKWGEAAVIFRLLAPTILVFALINPLAWLMLAIGHAGRSFRISLLIAPVVILGYLLGLPYGARGVAAGFSIAMLLLALPVILWAKHGTLITMADISRALLMPLTSAVVGAAVAFLFGTLVNQLQITLVRLIVECGILFGVYFVVMLFVMKQGPTYMALLRETGLWPVPGLKWRKTG